MNKQRAFYKYQTHPRPLVIAASDEGICGVWFEGQNHFGKPYLQDKDLSSIDFTSLTDTSDIRVLYIKDAVLWLNEYFAGKKPNPKRLTLCLSGTAFKKCVLLELLDIPYGQTTTYKQLALDVANKIGKESMSAQAVGGAVSRNPISIIIPCHRVIAQDGNLTGYAAGLDIKQFLLFHEL